MSRLLLILALHGASALPSGTLQHDTPTDVHAKIASLEASYEAILAEFNAQKAKMAALESFLLDSVGAKTMKNGATGAKKNVALVKSEAATPPPNPNPPFDPATNGTGGAAGGAGGGGTELLAASFPSGQWTGWQQAGNSGYSLWNYFYVGKTADGSIWLNCKDSTGNWSPNGVEEMWFSYHGSPELTHWVHGAPTEVFAPFAIDCKWS